MKPKKRDLEIFSLSFLDVISCGFGAVVLLVLISNFNDSVQPVDAAPAHAMLAEVLAAESRIETLQATLNATQAQADRQKLVAETLEAERRAAQAGLGRSEAEIAQLKQSAEGLALVQSSLKQAAITPKSSATRDVEVGGIPVDSEYVVFIVDTSGSMQQIWTQVVRVVGQVLDIHPQIKGFQILNDNGAHLISAYDGKWIPDTPRRRQSVLGAFRTWNSTSNSSPVEGLEVALRRYAKPGQSVSIYIFGDDYSGSSYDAVIAAVGRMNTNRTSNVKLAKIHAIGFMAPNTTNRFAILMREVTRRNGGTFIALSP